MKAEYINPFIVSVTELFESMLECTVQMGTPGIATEDDGVPDIIAVIGLSGTAQGTVALKLPIKTALKVVGRMVGSKFKTVDSSIIDGIGELVNIIAGNAKGRFEGHKITVSLPTVVRGSIYTLNNLENAIYLSVPFESELGNFSLLVTFKPAVMVEKEAIHADFNS
jgi:chemotaxis protein CheX